MSLFLSELSGHLNSLLMSWSTTYLIIHPHIRELQLKLAAVETHTRRRGNTHTTRSNKKEYKKKKHV